ncbi:MAG: hypothetical protein WC956_05985 [bacterium]
MLELLRKQIPGEEFDYQMLLEALKDYARPRDKITRLLRRKEIVRVKKGLYIFGESLSRRPFSREVLANMIYGPSYVSLDYALAYHGLIPERVEAVTSVTTKRSRRFATPIGLFIYRGIPSEVYPIGVDRVEIEGGRSFLIARPEKALADKVQADRGTGIRTQAEINEYLVKHLRIDESTLSGLNADLIAQIAQGYRSRRVALLESILRRQRRSAHA